ncbi:MAG: biotin/lipoyl-binding protein [Clostridia bacterium]|nr:biotin/lipoyl-binding protein [Clostridia bacterium]
MIYKVTLNGKIYEVDVEKGEAIIQKEYEAATPVATPVAAPQAPVAQAASAAAPAPAGSGNAVISPLPGTINAVKVQVGQTVKKGDVLFILEAMKMENDIPADRDGKIANIFVQKGATVETGAPLCEIQ